jgi:sulfur relay (sulfurtransferase) complex TusBCD TusD component (DsrE family)
LTVVRDLPEPPAGFLFHTDGVKLACDGSPVLDELRHFAEHGASIVLCGTCVDYFGLRDQVRIGTVAGITAIIEAIARADEVITP